MKFTAIISSENIGVFESSISLSIICGCFGFSDLLFGEIKNESNATDMHVATVNTMIITHAIEASSNYV